MPNLDPNTIKINADRYRRDLGDIEEFAKQMFVHGNALGINTNTVPIQITPEMELIAGERRLRACKHIKANLDPSWMIKAEVVLTDVSVEGRHRILEIIENKYRKQFDWQEDTRATKDLHELLLKEKTVAGDTASWSGRKTAKELGLSVGGVCQDINLANALEKAPELFDKCKTKEAAIAIIKDAKIKEMMNELNKRSASSNTSNRSSQILFLGDCNDLIDQLPKRSVYGIISDPMYGVSINDRSQDAGVSGFDDSMDTYRTTLTRFAAKADQILAESAIVCMFTAYDNVDFLNNLWSGYGFRMDPVPMIWHKEGAHATRDAAHYFGKSYEFIVYGTRGDAVILKTGAPNLISYSPISGVIKNHAFEKPLALMEELLARFCLPGQTILDFMAGDGTTLVAGIKRGVKALGFEIDKDCYNSARLRIAEALKAKDAGLADQIK